MARTMYTAMFAAEIRQSGGGLYRPANGTEGEMFMELWCSDCRKRDGCLILSASMACEINEPEYPREWRYDEAGQPQCAAHEEQAAAIAAREKARE